MFFFIATIVNCQTLPDDTFITKDFTYKILQDTSLQLTVFIPKDIIAKKSVMILFHGGAWRIGNRKIMFPICKYFAARDIVTVSASYRLIKDGTDKKLGKETCIKDAKSAIRWIKLHASELNIDTNKIILGGASAGGHLATMAALDSDINDALDNKTISTTASALTLFNPAYTPEEDQLVQPFKFMKSPAVPPTIMFFGTRDNFRIAGKVFLNGITNNIIKQIWYAPGQGHAFFNKEKGWLKAMCLKTDEFLVSLHLLNPAIDKSGNSGTFKFLSNAN